MPTAQQILKDLKFASQTQLVGFLNKHFTWKADKESIYILDKSNPERHRSREYEIKETKSGYLYLSEI